MNEECVWDSLVVAQKQTQGQWSQIEDSDIIHTPMNT